MLNANIHIFIHIVQFSHSTCLSLSLSPSFSLTRVGSNGVLHSVAPSTSMADSCGQTDQHTTMNAKTPNLQNRGF